MEGLIHSVLQQCAGCANAAAFRTIETRSSRSCSAARSEELWTLAYSVQPSGISTIAGKLMQEGGGV